MTKVPIKRFAEGSFMNDPLRYLMESRTVEELEARAAEVLAEYKRVYNDEQLRKYLPSARSAARKRMEELKEAGSLYEQDLYNSSFSVLEKEANAIDAELRELLRKAKETGDYAGTVGSYLFRFSGDGYISAQWGSRPLGKELQLASWLSRKGHDVEFLRDYGTPGWHYPDIRLDGEIWEIKRITSHNRTKLKARLSDGADQSDSIIVDLSTNDGDVGELRKAALEMLGDKRVKRIMVIENGNATIYEK